MKPTPAIPLQSNTRTGLTSFQKGFYSFLVEHYRERVKTLPDKPFLKESLRRWEKVVRCGMLPGYEGFLLPASQP